MTLLGGARSRRAAGVLAVYLALSVAYTWPLLRDGRSLVANDDGDPVLNTSILWRNATAIPLSADWWNAPHYYPSGDVTAFTENLLGISPIFSPVYWLTDNPIAAYNVAYFFTWPLSAFAAYLLLRFITRREDAAFLAGLAFGFTPYRTTEIAHIQSLSSYFFPMCLLGLHGFLEDHRSRWLWLFGSAWLLQSLADGYYMLLGWVLIGLWIAYFGSTRRSWRPAAAIVGAWGLSSLPLVPIMYRYSVVHEHFGFVRNINEILAYSAKPQSWAQVSGDVWFWRSVLPQGNSDLFPGLTATALVLIGSTTAMLRRRPEAPQHSPSLGLLRIGLGLVTTLSGVAILLALWVGPWSVMVAGILFRMTNLNRALLLIFVCGLPLLLMTPRTREALARRSPFVFYTAATVVIALLCCGPVVRVGEEVILSPAPYRWLMALPGFYELRVPPRFWMLGTLCLSVAAGLAFPRIRPSRPSLSLAAFSVAAAGLLLDGWMPIMRMAAPPAQWAEAEPPDRPEPILELPIGPDWDWAATFRAAGHRRRVFNGVSGYDPPHYAALRAGLDSRDPSMLAALASLGSFDVVVNGAADADSAWARYVSSAPGADRLGDDGHRTVFRIPQAPPEPLLGEVLPIARVQAFRYDASFVHDGKIETGWGAFPQEPGQWLVIDLGSVREVGGLTHAIGEYFLDFPRRLAIELSPDGTVWNRVWEGPGAAPAFLALVRGPREGAMHFTFNARPARFVRLIQLESYRSMWRVSELQVHAPAR